MTKIREPQHLYPETEWEFMGIKIVMVLVIH